MRICILIEYFYPDNDGGTGADISYVARCIRDRHAEVEIDVITSKNLYRGAPRPLPAFEDWDGIKIYRLGTPGSNQSTAIKRLGAGLLFTGAVFLKLLTRPRYDLVFVVTNPPTLAMAAQAYRRL